MYNNSSKTAGHVCYSFRYERQLFEQPINTIINILHINTLYIIAITCFIHKQEHVLPFDTKHKSNDKYSDKPIGIQ